MKACKPKHKKNNPLYAVARSEEPTLDYIPPPFYPIMESVVSHRPALQPPHQLVNFTMAAPPTLCNIYNAASLDVFRKPPAHQGPPPLAI